MKANKTTSILIDGLLSRYNIPLESSPDGLRFQSSILKRGNRGYAIISTYRESIHSKEELRFFKGMDTAWVIDSSQAEVLDTFLGAAVVASAASREKSGIEIWEIKPDDIELLSTSLTEENCDNDNT